MMDIIQRISLLKERVAKLNSGVLAGDHLDIAILLILYSYNHIWAKEADGVIDIPSICLSEIICISQEQKDIKNYLSGLFMFFRDFSDELNILLSRGEFNFPVFSFHQMLDFYLESVRRNEIGEASTPTYLINMIHDLTVSKKDVKYLDMNARTGEWARYLYRNSNEREVRVSNRCSSFFGYIISRLLSKATYNGNLNTSLFDLESGYELPKNEFDMIFANPPFNVKTYDGKTGQMVSSDILFLREAVESVTPKGKIAIIVPEGLLFSSNVQAYATRKSLTDGRIIKAIIRFSEKVFGPYSKIRTAILLIDKSEELDSIRFVDLSNFGKDLSVDVLTSVVEFVKNDIPSSDISVEKINFKDVANNNYDWQVQTYIREQDDTDKRSADELRGEIERKKKRLEIIRSRISQKLDEMEMIR